MNFSGTDVSPALYCASNSSVLPGRESPHSGAAPFFVLLEIGFGAFNVILNDRARTCDGPVRCALADETVPTWKGIKVRAIPSAKADPAKDIRLTLTRNRVWLFGGFDPVSISARNSSLIPSISTPPSNPCSSPPSSNSPGSFRSE